MSGVAPNSSTSDQEIPVALFDEDQHDALMERLDGSNINKETLLTTDYLNHFSAMFMLLEMLPVDPLAFAVDILTWEPKTYAEHMTESGFRESQLAIVCYEYSDPQVRQAFDKIIAQLEDQTKLVIERLTAALDHERFDQIQELCSDAVPQMRQLVEHAASIVNGDKELIAGICAEELVDEEQQTSSQDDIDALFD